MYGDINRHLQLQHQLLVEEICKFQEEWISLQALSSSSQSSLPSSLDKCGILNDNGDVPLINGVNEENKENIPDEILSYTDGQLNQKKSPLVERLDLSSIENSRNRDKELFINKLINSENLVTSRSDVSNSHAMLRHGQFRANKPESFVTAGPSIVQYLGFGEYEQWKHILKQQRRDDYKQFIERKFQHESHFNGPSTEKDVSTQIIKLGKENQGMQRNNNSLLNNRVDQRYNSHNSYIKTDNMDKPKSILTNRKNDSSRDHFISDLRHGYSTTFLDGFSYKDEEEELERERLKREIYQTELRNQIEEKRHLAALREEQDRREQELENRRLEQQLLRMQDEQIRDEQRRNRRDEQLSSFKLMMDSDTCLRYTKVASKQSHYSPPVSRRNLYSYNIPSSSSVYAEPSASRYNPNRCDFLTRKDVLNRMDSINTIRDTNSRLNSFSRYDSLSRIDSLNRQEALSRLESLSIKDNLNRVQRRHSATQQDLSMLRKSPKSQRRSSSTSRYELDTLPIPILKVHSPVAKELKNSIAVSSSKHSDALTRLEDKWKIPGVQRNIINHGDPFGDRAGDRYIYTQIGAIRMQLQQEQRRMDEALRRKGYPTI